MGYVGNPQATAFSSKPAKQDLTGASGTSLTLSHAVANSESISLFINNVRQEPTTAYSVSGTAVTLTGSVIASDDIYVIYNSLALQEIVPPDGSVSTAKIADGSVTAAKLAAGAAFAAGMVMPTASASAPSGWLMAYGQAVSRSTYADLFTAIGTTYGVGDGSSTFNLPDLRGRVIAGQDDMGGTSANRLTDQSGGLNGDTLGDTGGTETHQLTVAEMAAHRHGLGVQDTSGQNDYLAGSNNNYGFQVTSNSTYASTTSVGSDTAHNNVQPTIILNYIIKT
jgi:microcystin-dependent protein